MVSLSIGKWILFLKDLEFNSFLNFYIWACCHILYWNLVFVIYIQYVLHNSYTLSCINFIYVLSNFFPVWSFNCRWNNNLIMLLYERNICFILENFVLFLSHFLVNTSTVIDKVVSVLFSQFQSNTDEHDLTQDSFSTNY